MSRLAKILLALIIVFLILTVYLFGTIKFLMIGVVLLMVAYRFNKMANRFREDQKIERMGDYFTAYKLAKDFDVPEETVAAWCRQGRVPGAFKRSNLWLIPRDVTVHDIALPTEKYPKDRFQ
jgi:hypothetical protein